MTRRKGPASDEAKPLPFEPLGPVCTACGKDLALSDIDWELFHLSILVHNRGECLANGNARRAIRDEAIDRALDWSK